MQILPWPTRHGSFSEWVVKRQGERSCFRQAQLYLYNTSLSLTRRVVLGEEVVVLQGCRETITPRSDSRHPLKAQPSLWENTPLSHARPFRWCRAVIDLGEKRGAARCTLVVPKGTTTRSRRGMREPRLSG